MTSSTHDSDSRALTARVLGYDLFQGARQELIRHLLEAVASARTPYRVGYLNAAQFNAGEDDPEFRERLRSMDLLYADGQSIVWAAGRCGVSLPERITAADFIGDFLREAASAGLAIALVGGVPGSAEQFASYWKREIPGLDLPFLHHGFFGASEQSDLAHSIRSSGAQVVLIGLGAPRQEDFVTQFNDADAPRVLWCVGALFEYGPWGKRRAPAWMRNAGLEWAFRLAQEPRRLARRYLLGNPLFVWRVLTRSEGE